MSSSTVATDFTNASIESISKHAEVREVAACQSLRDRVLEGGFRLLSRQHHSTKSSSRSFRLFTWYHIRRQEPEDVVEAVKEVQRRTRARAKYQQYQTLLTAAELREDPIYHVVMRGKDPCFSPPDDTQLVDIVTTYFVEGFEERVAYLTERFEEVLTGYDELGEEPHEAFRQLMSDVGFVRLLEDYFASGDTRREDNFKLAGRLNDNFLHKVIKGNHVQLLQDLLDNYTKLSEAVAQQPWLRLAEPLLPVGKYQLTAFHRAVYDGHHQCLRVLLDYVDRHHIDITDLRNREPKHWQQEHGCQGMNLLEMAEEQENFACYNLLSPYFGSERKDHDADLTLRANRNQDLLKPRVELQFAKSTGLQPAVVEVGDDAGELPMHTWQDVATGLRVFLQRDPVQALPAEQAARTRCPTESFLLVHNISMRTCPTLDEAQGVCLALVDAAQEAYDADRFDLHSVKFVCRVPDPGRASFVLLQAMRHCAQQRPGNRFFVQCHLSPQFCALLPGHDAAGEPTVMAMQQEVHDLADEYLRGMLAGGELFNIGFSKAFPKMQRACGAES